MDNSAYVYCGYHYCVKVLVLTVGTNTEVELVVFSSAVITCVDNFATC